MNTTTWPGPTVKPSVGGEPHTVRFVVGGAWQAFVFESRGKSKPKVLKLPEEHKAVTPEAMQAGGTAVPVTEPAATGFPSRSKIVASGAPPVQSAGLAQISIPPIVKRPPPPALNETEDTFAGVNTLVRRTAANGCKEPMFGSTPATAAVF
ncbi:MAG: hypothetical protein KatS3mg077_2844 [Candidatus Binatia bacterium]|nr:MAG: hypothetical protein KatS3mg077_2844 [Candidatus Binatia bacterium]